MDIKTASAYAQMISTAAKRESTPTHEHVFSHDEDCCTELAPSYVKDSWGDSCEGCRCLRKRSHTGSHEASDGANGWVRW